MARKTELKAIEFLAFIPPLQTALTFGEDSARIKLDIPLECREQAKALVDFQGRELRVLMQVIDD